MGVGGGGRERCFIHNFLKGRDFHAPLKSSGGYFSDARSDSVYVVWRFVLVARGKRLRTRLGGSF